MGRGVRYHGMSLAQLCRLTACERKESECEGGFTRQDVASALEVEVTQAGRFIRDAARAGWMVCVSRPRKRGLKGRCSTYEMSCQWRDVAAELRERGVLPDTCAHPGCSRQALPFRFRSQYWCREHLMAQHCEGCSRRSKDGVCPRAQPQEVPDDDGDDRDA